MYVWGFFWPADRNGQQSLTDDNFNCRSHPSLWPQTPRSTLRNKREREAKRKKLWGLLEANRWQRETTFFPIIAADSRCTNSKKILWLLYIVLCRWSTTTKIYNILTFNVAPQTGRATVCWICAGLRRRWWLENGWQDQSLVSFKSPSTIRHLEKEKQWSASDGYR